MFALKSVFKLRDFGTYQLLQFFLYLLPAVTSSIHMLSLQVVAAVPAHRCRIPNVDLSPTSNFTIGNLETYIPKSEEGSYDNCYMFNLTDKDNNLMKCESWVYDTTYHKSSRGMEWSFVCDRQWMGAVAQSAYMFGMLIGFATFGSAADKYGRKPVFCWSAIFQLISGVTIAFVPNYYTFLIVQLFYGAFGSVGCYITAFVLCMELIGSSKRTFCGTSLHAAFSVGVMLVAAWGALIHDRQVLQLVYGLHGVLLLGHLWWLDESPRWLWANNRPVDAVKIVQKGLKINGNFTELDVNYYLSKSIKIDKSVVKGNTLDLFKTPSLRKKILIICFLWFANSLLYFGLSFSTGKLNGNPFVLLCLTGLVELPGYILTIALMDRLGRRLLTSCFTITGGISCIVGAYLFRGSTVSTTFTMIGKFASASSFAMIYNYTAELFPTVIRNSAIGIAGMSSRLSSTLTPLFYLLDHSNSPISITIFGVISIISGFFVFLLPETLGTALPQTLEDTKSFRNKDTVFLLVGSKKKLDNTKLSEAEEAV